MRRWGVWAAWLCAVAPLAWPVQSPSPSPAPSPAAAPVFVEAAEPGVVRPEQVRLLQAARRGELDIVRGLVEAGESVNPPAGSRTPLIAAALHGHIAVMEYVTAKGAEINARDRLGRSALWAAVWAGQREAFDWLLAHGADVNVAAKTGDPLLFLAVEARQLDMARALIEHGAPVERASRSPLWQGFTPLQRAVTLRDVPMVALLRGKGADPRAKNDKGATALDLAHALGAGADADEIRRLLRAGGGE